MKDWSNLKLVALRAQPFNATDYAVTSLGSRASEILDLIAENESLRKDSERLRDVANELLQSVDCHSLNHYKDDVHDHDESCKAFIRIRNAINRSPENPS